MAWAVHHIEATGCTVTGPASQPRVRPWSTQLVLPTDEGTVWFKANQRYFAFEAALQVTIAALVPGAVQAPLGADLSRGWMLTADHGPSMGDDGPPSPDAWTELVREAAAIQRALVGHRGRLLATGMPDCAPERAVAWFDELRTTLRALPPEHPTRLGDDDERLLDAAREVLGAACTTLAESGLPATWNHGDLHPHNAYLAPDGGPDTTGTRLFDLGDSQWSHPLEILVVPHTCMREQGLGDEVAAATSAWAEVWGVEVDDALLSAARVVQAVNRSRTWWSWLDDTTPDELARYGPQTREHLLRVLAGPGPTDGL